MKCTNGQDLPSDHGRSCHLWLLVQQAPTLLNAVQRFLSRAPKADFTVSL
jgi:hypothetical protein